MLEVSVGFFCGTVIVYPQSYLARQRHDGSLPVSKKIRKFRLKVKWNSDFPENPCGNWRLFPVVLSPLFPFGTEWRKFPYYLLNFSVLWQEEKNRVLQIPPVVPYKSLGNFWKALYETTGGTCSARFFRQSLISRSKREIELQMASAISFGWFADFGKAFTIIQRSSQSVYSDKW